MMLECVCVYVCVLQTSSANMVHNELEILSTPHHCSISVVFKADKAILLNKQPHFRWKQQFFEVWQTYNSKNIVYNRLSKCKSWREQRKKMNDRWWLLLIDIYIYIQIQSNNNGQTKTCQNQNTICNAIAFLVVCCRWRQRQQIFIENSFLPTWIYIYVWQSLGLSFRDFPLSWQKSTETEREKKNKKKTKNSK